MTLSTLGWIDGITASMVVIFGLVFGFYFILKGQKRKAKQLTQIGLVTMLAGLMYLGVFLDFVLVVSTGKNIDNSWGAAALLSYIWFGPLMVFVMNIGARLHFPEPSKLNIRRAIFIISLTLSTIFTIISFLDPFTTFYFGYPKAYPNDHPETLIDYNTNMTSAAGIIMMLLMVSVLLFLGVGVLIKAMKLSGEIRKRLLLVGLGFLSFVIFGVMEGLTIPGAGVIFLRIGYSCSFIVMYSGLK